MTCHRAWWLPGLALMCVLTLPASQAQVLPEDTNESAYQPGVLARILGGVARSQNDEAELAAAGDWFVTTAAFTGARRPPSGRFRPLLSAWIGSRGESRELTELYFNGDLPELQFEQAGRKYWLLSAPPAGLGFEVYPPGQKLTLYVQRVGFASGTPVAVLRMVTLPGSGATVVAAGQRLRGARVGEGARRQEALYGQGSANFRYAGRDYSLPLDRSGKHSVAPGLYRYANGVRTALLEYGAGDDRYLLLRVSSAEGADAGTAAGVVPYLVLNGRIVPPIDLSRCTVTVSEADRDGARGTVDCAGVERAVLQSLTFSAH